MLRQRDMQIEQLQNKLLALVGDAADRYAKMRMMEMTSERMGAMRGVLPAEEFVNREEVDPVDELFSQLEDVPRGTVGAGGRS